MAEITNMESQIQSVRNRLAEIKRPFEQAIDRVRALGAQDVILYDVTTRAGLTYNARLGTAWSQVKLPRGISFDQSKLKALLKGNLTPPNIDPISLVTTLGLIEASVSDTYDTWAAPTGGNDRPIYIASRRFVENDSADQITSQLAIAVFTGGATLAGTADAYKDQLLLEWADMLSWLKGAGEQQAGDIAARVISALYRFDRAGLQRFPNVDFMTSRVDYTYRVALKVADQLIEPLRMLGINGRDVPSLQVTMPHMGFAFSISNLSQLTLDRVVADFRNALLNGPTMEGLDLHFETPEEILPFRLSQVALFKDSTGADSIRSLLAGVINLNTVRLQDYHVGNLRFDLRETAFAREFERRFKAIAIGNQGAARVKVFMVDGIAQTVWLDLEIVHKHNLGTVGDMVSRLGSKLQEATTAVSTQLQTLLQNLSALRTQYATLLSNLERLRSAEANARAAVETVRGRLKNACSVQIPGFGRVTHPACALL